MPDSKKEKGPPPRAAVAPIARKRVVEQVADELRSAILSGRFAPHDPLPPERELAATLRVSRLTLHSALFRLEAEGLVRVAQGKPTRVLDYRRSAGLDLLTYLSRHEESGEAPPASMMADLLELRRLLGVEAMALAAERHQAADLEALRAEIERQRARLDDPAAFSLGDLEVVRLFVRATHNVALEMVFNSVERFTRAHDALSEAMYQEPTALCAAYEGLLALLPNRDPALVREVARNAFCAADEQTLLRLRPHEDAGRGRGAKRARSLTQGANRKTGGRK